MATKRGRNEGSIFQRTDRRWCAVVDLGWDDGKRKRKYLYADTRAEVAEALNKALRDKAQGLPIAPERLTVAQFLNHWLDDSVKPTVRPLTYRSYDQIACLVAPELRALRPRQLGRNGKPFATTRAVTEGIGGLRLHKLTPQHVQSLLNRRLDEGLSARTVQYMLVVLRRGFSQAVKWGLASRNVAEMVDGPRVQRPERQPLAPAEARKLLDAIRGDRLEALYSVALALGLREGEALGLCWSDIDLETRIVQVRRALQRSEGTLRFVEPKSQRSRRSIAMPEIVVKALRAHRARQLQERLIAGPQWRDTGLVFTSRLGTPIDPRNMVRMFKRMLAKAGLRDQRFHDLRHGAASLLLAQGVHPRVVMELLGHSQISLTMEIYSHVTSDLMREAAEKMNAILVEPRLEIRS
jgi:integrase